MAQDIFATVIRKTKHFTIVSLYIILFPLILGSIWTRLLKEREFYLDFQREERLGAERMRNMAGKNPYLKPNPVNLIYIYPFFPDKNGLIPLGDMGESECKLYLKPYESDIGYSVLAERFPKFYEYNVTVTQSAFYAAVKLKFLFIGGMPECIFPVYKCFVGKFFFRLCQSHLPLSL